MGLLGVEGSRQDGMVQAWCRKKRKMNVGDPQTTHLAEPGTLHQFMGQYCLHFVFP